MTPEERALLMRVAAVVLGAGSEPGQESAAVGELLDEEKELLELWHAVDEQHRVAALRTLKRGIADPTQ